jgi:hypothetical protein
MGFTVANSMAEIWKPKNCTYSVRTSFQHEKGLCSFTHYQLLFLIITYILFVLTSTKIGPR